MAMLQIHRQSAVIVALAVALFGLGGPSAQADDEGTVIGGLVGATYLGWLQVHAVWLPDSVRGHNYGTQLMEIAEAEALRRGCTRSFLETFSFQALPFYEKFGYVVHSRLPNFPIGGARYSLTKNLA